MPVKKNIKKGGFNINDINFINNIEQIDLFREIIVKPESKIYISIGGKINRLSHISHNFTSFQNIPGFLFDTYDDDNNEIIIILIDKFIDQEEFELNKRWINERIKNETRLVERTFNINIIICNMYYNENIHDKLYVFFKLKYPINNSISNANRFKPSNKNWIICNYVLFFNENGPNTKEGKILQKMDNILNKYNIDKNFSTCIYEWAGLRNINIIYLRNNKPMFMFNRDIIPKFNSNTQIFSNDNIQSFLEDKNNNTPSIKSNKKKLKNICNYSVDIFSYYNKKNLPIYPFVKPLSMFIE